MVFELVTIWIPQVQIAVFFRLKVNYQAIVVLVFNHVSHVD
jgi:hypothetical protein